MDYIIREMNQADYPLLREFLYESIFLPEGAARPPKSVIDSPELRVYTADFGDQPDDIAYLAEADGQAVGAVWVRIMNDYGHVDDKTPSLAIALYKDYQGWGIGTALMKQMLQTLKEKGYGQVSLSVQKANYAVGLYLQVGFVIIGEHDEDYLMVCQL